MRTATSNQKVRMEVTSLFSVSAFLPLSVSPSLSLCFLSLCVSVGPHICFLALPALSPYAVYLVTFG